MTQMGFVTMVLLPPAIMEDQKLITTLLPANCQPIPFTVQAICEACPKPSDNTCDNHVLRKGRFHVL